MGYDVVYCIAFSLSCSTDGFPMNETLGVSHAKMLPRQTHTVLDKTP